MLSTDNTTYNDACPWWDSDRGLCSIETPVPPLRKNLFDFLQEELKKLTDKYRLHIATVWSLDPVNCKLILLATEGIPFDDFDEPICDYSRNLSGVVVDSRIPQVFKDVSARRRDGRSFSYPELIKKMKLKSMICIPVLNTYNINQVLLIVDLFPYPGDTPRRIEMFTRYCDALAVRFETFLRDRCSRFANRISMELGRMRYASSKDIYRLLEKFLTNAVELDSVHIYSESPDGLHIECRNESSGPSTEIDELAKECWKANREFLTISRIEKRSIYRGELMPQVQVKYKAIRRSVFVPLRDPTGQAKGVFCCMKTRETEHGHFLPFYTYEDIAVIDAIGQAFAPFWEILQTDNIRNMALQKLAHQLKAPLIAFKVATKELQSECKKNAYSFQYNHFNVINTYCDVMQRLVFELDILRKGIKAIPLETKLTDLDKDIIAPAVHYIEPLLAAKKLSQRSIHIENIGKYIPKLYIDVTQMTQVIFNLIENSIKYFIGDRKEFTLDIQGRDTKAGFEIIFRDNGIGIPEGYEDSIFHQGFRAPHAEEFSVAGEGLGLWYARGIVRHHGGDLVLRNQKNPTTFIIILPHSLKSAPPEEKDMVEE